MKGLYRNLSSVSDVVGRALFYTLACLAFILLFAACSNAEGEWRIETVMHANSPYDLLNHSSRIAVGAEGNPHIVAAPTIGWDGPLLYGHKVSGLWSVERVSYGFLGGLGLDSQGNVHTTYWPMYYPPVKRDGAHYAVRTAGGWTDNKIEEVGGSPSLVVDRSDIPHVATFYTVSTSPSVSALRFASKSGDSWLMSDALLPQVVNLDYSPKLATVTDSSGWGYIACIISTMNGESPVAELLLATQTASGWTVTTIDTLSADSLTFDNILDMAIDEDNHLHIIYWDEANYFSDGPYIKYATNTSGFWTTSILLRNAFYPAIAIDRDNNVHVVFNTYWGDLGYLSNASGEWVTSTIKSGSGAVNILSDITVDDTGRVHVSYYDPGAGLLQYAVYPVAGVSLDKVGPAQVTPNETVIYRITVTNHGPDDATSVVVSDAIPDDITLISAPASQGSCEGIGTLTCNLGSLTVGMSAMITINAQVKATASNQICNTASVSAGGDPDNSDNSSTTCMAVVRAVVNITPTDPVAKEEGQKAGVLTVNRSGETTNSLIVNYSVSGSATPGTDYEELAGTVEFKAGEASSKILIIPLSDTLREEDETVTVTLSSDPSYIVGLPSSATVTIQDYAGPNFSISDLAGVWHVQALGDSISANNPHWRSCTMMVDMFGFLSGGECYDDQGNMSTVTGGSLESDIVGQVTGSLTLSNGTAESFQYGKLDANKNILTLTSYASDFRGLFVASRRSGTFAISDLAGTWYINGFGDYLSGNHPNWKSGTIAVNATGAVTSGNLAGFWDATPVSIASGSLGVDNTGQVTGSITLSNGTTEIFQYGKLDESKNFLTLVDSAPNFRGLFVGSKGEGTFAASDLAGTWYFYTMGDNPFLNNPRWTSGRMIVDSWGSLLGGYIINDLGEIRTLTGSFTVQADGEVSGLITISNGGAMIFPHGKLDAGKGILSLIHSAISESVGLFVAIKGGSNRSVPPPVILWRNTLTGRTTFWYMDGATWTGEYADVLPTISGSEWTVAGLSDFNGDGNPDLLWRNNSTGRTTIWYMDGPSWNGQYADVEPTLADPNWSIVGIADFNRDGSQDLLWRNNSSGRTTIWYMTGPTWNGGYADVEPTLTDPNWSIVGIADFNRDGSPDLLWRNSSDGRTTIWYMTGPTWNGGYAEVLPTLNDPNWSIVAIRDFNNDGSPDLLWRNTSNVPGDPNAYRTTVWYMDGPVWNGNWGDLLPIVSDPNWVIIGR